MSEYKGTADTVGKLIELLEQFDTDKPVRMATLSHTWPVEVVEHERCVMLEV
jgi:hypothetical protein